MSDKVSIDAVSDTSEQGDTNKEALGDAGQNQVSPDKIRTL